jgi:polynucleotide 5'-hydroxyl-kinase GRC3/NOL9
MGIDFHGGKKRMNRIVESGKTLLVDGPASVEVVSGRVEAFGFMLGSAGKTVIREGKRLPFAVKKTATFNILLGENASIEEVEENTIPLSWQKAGEELLGFRTNPVTAMVLGAVGSGKTSFCTYLINNLLNAKLKVAVLDGDIGQSDIGPPSTISYAFVKKPVMDLFNLKAENAYFVGVTSPSKAIEKVIDGLASLEKEILSDRPDFIVVNTDGWVEGEEAANYKVKLVKHLNPNIVFYIQQKEESAPIPNTLEKPRKVIVDSPSEIKHRSREKRKSLRELGYVKYLRNAKVRSLPLNWLQIEENELIGTSGKHGSTKKARKIYELLGMKPLHFTELRDRICVVIGKSRWIETENIRKIEEFMKKTVVIIRRGEEQGLLTALHDAEKRFLGIGVLREIDYTRNVMKVYTPVSDEVSIVAIGRVKVDKDLREITTFVDEDKHNFTTFKS